MDFDHDFSNTIIISYSDVVHGSLMGKKKLAEVPEDAAFIIKVFRVRVDDRDYVLFVAEKVTGRGVARIYQDRLPSLDKLDKRIDILSKALGIERGFISEIAYKTC